MPETDDRYVERPCTTDSGVGQKRIQFVGDVMQAAAGMQVRGLANLYLHTLFGDVVQTVAGILDAAQRFVVDGNFALSLGRRLAPPAQVPRSRFKKFRSAAPNGRCTRRAGREFPAFLYCGA